MEEAFDKEREKAKGVVKDKGVEVGAEDTWETFAAALPAAGEGELEGVSGAPPRVPVALPCCDALLLASDDTVGLPTSAELKLGAWGVLVASLHT